MQVEECSIVYESERRIDLYNFSVWHRSRVTCVILVFLLVQGNASKHPSTLEGKICRHRTIKEHCLVASSNHGEKVLHLLFCKVSGSQKFYIAPLNECIHMRNVWLCRKTNESNISNAHFGDFFASKSGERVEVNLRCLANSPPTKELHWPQQHLITQFIWLKMFHAHSMTVFGRFIRLEAVQLVF